MFCIYWFLIKLQQITINRIHFNFLGFNFQLLGGYICTQSEIQIWLFRILRSWSCPCWYLAHLYVICCHFIESCVTISRPCCLSKFYPNEASIVAYVYTTVVIVLFLNQQKTSQQVIFGPKKIPRYDVQSHNAFADFFVGWRDSPLSRSISTGITMTELQSIWQATQITFNLLHQLQLIKGRFKTARTCTFVSSASSTKRCILVAEQLGSL